MLPFHSLRHYSRDQGDQAEGSEDETHELYWPASEWNSSAGSISSQSHHLMISLTGFYHETGPAPAPRLKGPWR